MSQLFGYLGNENAIIALGQRNRKQQIRFRFEHRRLWGLMFHLLRIFVFRGYLIANITNQLCGQCKSHQLRTVYYHIVCWTWLDYFYFFLRAYNWLTFFFVISLSFRYNKPHGRMWKYAFMMDQNEIFIVNYIKWVRDLFEDSYKRLRTDGQKHHLVFVWVRKDIQDEGSCNLSNRISLF